MRFRAKDQWLSPAIGCGDRDMQRASTGHSPNNLNSSPLRGGMCPGPRARPHSCPWTLVPWISFGLPSVPNVEGVEHLALRGAAAPESEEEQLATTKRHPRAAAAQPGSTSHDHRMPRPIGPATFAKWSVHLRAHALHRPSKRAPYCRDGGALRRHRGRGFRVLVMRYPAFPCVCSHPLISPLRRVAEERVAPMADLDGTTVVITGAIERHRGSHRPGARRPGGEAPPCVPLRVPAAPVSTSCRPRAPQPSGWCRSTSATSTPWGALPTPSPSGCRASMSSSTTPAFRNPGWSHSERLRAGIGTNHVGHFLYTTRLLDALGDGAPRRVVTVASKSHYQAKGIDFDAVRRPTAR